MTDLITNEITGGAVAVTIAGRACQLSYPLHAIFLYKRLTGESLFQFDNWKRIDFEENYDCWISCLWAGLHELQDGKWLTPFTRPELETVLGFSNAGDIHASMVEALTAWMPKAKEAKAGAAVEPEKKSTSSSSPESGSAAPDASDSPAPAS
jgi:hypothetical protein